MVLGSTFRKIFNLIYNQKKTEKISQPPDFPLELLRSSSEIQKTVIDKKDSGSSQEPLIESKESGSISSRDDILSEKIQNTELL